MSRNYKPNQSPFGLGFFISLILHVGLLLFFVFSPKACQSQVASQADSPAVIKPQEVVAVQLWGETPKFIEAGSPLAPSEDALENSQASEAPTEPQELLEDSSSLLEKLKVPDPQATAIGREAKPEPKLARKNPPKVSAPKVQPDPPAPKAKQPDSNKPRDLRQMVAKSFGRSAAERMFGSPDGRIKNDDLDRYYKQIMSKFRKHWKAPSPNLSNRLQVGFSISIEPDGRIFAVNMVGSSGNPDFDRSVDRALRSSSPLPPLPSVLGGGRHTVTLWFNPERL